MRGVISYCRFGRLEPNPGLAGYLGPDCAGEEHGDARLDEPGRIRCCTSRRFCCTYFQAKSGSRCSGGRASRQPVKEKNWHGVFSPNPECRVCASHSAKGHWGPTRGHDPERGPRWEWVIELPPGRRWRC